MKAPTYEDGCILRASTKSKESKSRKSKNANGKVKLVSNSSVDAAASFHSSSSSSCSSNSSSDSLTASKSLSTSSSSTSSGKRSKVPSIENEQPLTIKSCQSVSFTMDDDIMIGFEDVFTVDQEKSNPTLSISHMLNLSPSARITENNLLACKSDDSEEDRRIFERQSQHAAQGHVCEEFSATCVEPFDCVNIKILLLGDSGVGKSCLTRRFLGGCFNDQMPTIRVEMNKMYVDIAQQHQGGECRLISAGRHQHNVTTTTAGSSSTTDVSSSFGAGAAAQCRPQGVLCHFWDTPSGPETHAITTAYCSRAHVTVLVIDVCSRASLDSVDYWCRRVYGDTSSTSTSTSPCSSYCSTASPACSLSSSPSLSCTMTSPSGRGGGVKMVVVGSKADREQDRQFTTLEGEHAAAQYQLPYIEVSASSSLNSTQLLERLIQLSLSLDGEDKEVLNKDKSMPPASSQSAVPQTCAVVSGQSSARTDTDPHQDICQVKESPFTVRLGSPESGTTSSNNNTLGSCVIS